MYQAQGRIAEAATLQELLAEGREFGDDRPDTLTTKHNLVSTYWAQGMSVEAAALLEVLAERREVLGDNHPDTLTTNHNLASMYRAHGRTAEATTLRGYEIQNRLASPRGNRRIL